MSLATVEDRGHYPYREELLAHSEGRHGAGVAEHGQRVEQAEKEGEATEEDTLPPNELQRYKFYGTRPKSDSRRHLESMRAFVKNPTWSVRSASQGLEAQCAEPLVVRRGVCKGTQNNPSHGAHADGLLTVVQTNRPHGGHMMVPWPCDPHLTLNPNSSGDGQWTDAVDGNAAAAVLPLPETWMARLTRRVPLPATLEQRTRLQASSPRRDSHSLKTSASPLPPLFGRCWRCTDRACA